MKVSLVIISKDEPALAATLAAVLGEDGNGVGPALGPEFDPHDLEVVVVDASAGRLDGTRDRFAPVKWAPFQQPPRTRVTIPHQRNAGVAEAVGDIIVFTDAGCLPAPGWLGRLVQPIVSGQELVTCGTSSQGSVYDPWSGAEPPEYLEEAPTINLAVARSVFDRIGGFDERFAYGSDMDFTWRAREAGIRIRFVPDAGVSHDWGTGSRQLKRAVAYGRAKVRLYDKHRSRIVPAIRQDPVTFAYPLYLLGLPFALKNWRYLLLLAVPLYRARRRPFPVRTVAEHLAQGAGCLQELWGMARARV